MAHHILLSSAHTCVLDSKTGAIGDIKLHVKTQVVEDDGSTRDAERWLHLCEAAPIDERSYTGEFTRPQLKAASENEA